MQTQQFYCKTIPFYSSFATWFRHCDYTSYQTKPLEQYMMEAGTINEISLFLTKHCHSGMFHNSQ